MRNSAELSRPSYEELQRELNEARRQQAATSLVLKVISGSKFDLNPVLESLLQSARDLCNAEQAMIHLRDGDVFPCILQLGWPAAFEQYMRDHPITPGRHSVTARVALTGSVVHVPDVLADPEYRLSEAQKLGGYRAVLGIPLLREGKVIGAFALGRPVPRAFTEHEIGLVQTFADQAVIAIETVRLFDEVDARTRDLAEALQQQTATADVLKVISGSTFDLPNVLETLTQSSAKLCGADRSCIFQREGDLYHLVSTYGFSPEFVEYGKSHPFTAGSHTTTGRVAVEGRAIHYPDVLALPDYAASEYQRLGHYRSILGIPLLREGAPIGVFIMTRDEVRPFSQRQIDLVQSFADQAVIAIENVRLFEEVRSRTRDLTEALQQQTATAEVLKVISRSTFDLQSVLETLVESAARLCEADMVSVNHQRADVYQQVAQYGQPPELVDYLDTHPIRLGRGTTVGRTILEGRPVQIPDLLEDPEFQFVDAARAGGVRTSLGVPLLRGDTPIGVMVLQRRVVKPFTDKQIELVQSFADQAVIAIENVRLITELKERNRETSEALQQQTATAEVLKLISRSAFDLDTVLTTLLQSALSLCRAPQGNILLPEGDGFRLETQVGLPEAFLKFMRDNPITPGSHSVVARVALTGSIVHVPDVLADPEYRLSKAQELGGFRAVLGVPMIRDGKVVGIFTLCRPAPVPFTQREIELVQTFSDQALIAIENVRLFEEVNARTRDLSEALQQQTATADVLKVISRSTFDLPTVLETLTQSAAELCEADRGSIFQRHGDSYRPVTNFRFPPEWVVHGEKHPVTPSPDTVTGRVLLECRPVHHPDVLTVPNYAASEYQRIGRYRSILGVPLLREGEPVGVFILTRDDVRPFTERQIELVQSFADQAVIAIENVRLFEEVNARTRDLTAALQQQTATADVLKIISRSAFDLQAVLDTLVQSAARYCDADRACIFRKEGDLYRCVSTVGFSPEWVAYAQTHPLAAGSRSGTGRVALEGRAVHIHDVLADPDYDAKEHQRLGMFRTLLGVPLLREGAPIGVFILTRAAVRPFDERHIEVVQTFADQAGIAIENVRLFDEVQARTDALARSLDELRLAQNRLVQTEKLASLGQLTAGIAHEIKNPLNFVNNFSSLSADLVDELLEILGPAPLDHDVRAEVEELSRMLKGNLEKVVQHGRRADSIVRNMLLHSREGSGERRPTDVNALVEESMNLAYHGARAEKPGFNVTLRRELDPDAGEADLYPQEITRVLLNLISNGFYATGRKAENGDPAFEPTVVAGTRNLGDSVEIRIRDNGTGIPDGVRAKMFNPFFTTKPAGEGTGLGLSLSQDIVVKQHGGTIDVATSPGAFTEFTILLPRNSSPKGSMRSGT